MIFTAAEGQGEENILNQRRRTTVKRKIYGNKTYSPFPTLNQTLKHYLALIRRLHRMLGERVFPRALLWHLDMQIDFRARIPWIESDLQLEGVAGPLVS